jgi:beta-lactam-binding protein with PASTA domain
MAPEVRPGPPGEGPDDEATTQVDGEWPVAPQYNVVPEAYVVEQLQEERGAVTIAAPPRRWAGAPAALFVVAMVALLVLAGAAAAWLVTRPESSSANAPPTPSHGATTTPQRGGGPTGPTSTAATTTDTTSSTNTTSSIAETIAVLDVVGLPAGEATRKLRQAHLDPTIRLVPSSLEAGTVLSERPSAGVNVDRGTTVELRVARRPAPTRVTVPRLVDSTAATAKSRLSTLGLHWSVTTRASDQPSGTVLAQSPVAGARVEKGTTIRLTVSSGPAQVSVPDVTGLDAARARSRLEDAGFEVSVVDQPTKDPDQDGVVLDQDPAAGTDADKGSTVTITVGRLS